MVIHFLFYLTGAVFTTTYKGKTLITIGGYKFCFHRKSGSKTRWRCSSGQHQGCKAVIFTVDKIIIKMNNIHNHRPTEYSRIPILRMDS